MLGAITKGANWALAADVVVVWILCGALLYDYWKEWKEAE